VPVQEVVLGVVEAEEPAILFVGAAGARERLGAVKRRGSDRPGVKSFN
jgi:hypothetical protein